MRKSAFLTELCISTAFLGASLGAASYLEAQTPDQSAQHLSQTLANKTNNKNSIIDYKEHIIKVKVPTYKAQLPIAKVETTTVIKQSNTQPPSTPTGPIRSLAQRRAAEGKRLFAGRIFRSLVERSQRQMWVPPERETTIYTTITPYNPATMHHEQAHRTNGCIRNWSMAQPQYKHVFNPDPSKSTNIQTIQPIYFCNNHAALLLDIQQVSIEAIDQNIPPHLKSNGLYRDYVQNLISRNNQLQEKRYTGLALLDETTATLIEILGVMEVHDTHPFFDQKYYYPNHGRFHGGVIQTGGNGYFFMHMALALACTVHENKDHYPTEEDASNVLGTIQYVFEALVRKHDAFLNKKRYPRFIHNIPETNEIGTPRSYKDLLNDPNNAELIAKIGKVYGNNWLESLRTTIVPKPNSDLQLEH